MKFLSGTFQEKDGSYDFNLENLFEWQCIRNDSSSDSSNSGKGKKKQVGRRLMTEINLNSIENMITNDLFLYGNLSKRVIRKIHILFIVIPIF